MSDQDKRPPGRPPLPAEIEKRIKAIPLHCTVTEHATWKRAFGPREMSKTARELLNQEARARLAGQKGEHE